MAISENGEDNPRLRQETGKDISIFHPEFTGINYGCKKGKDSDRNT